MFQVTNEFGKPLPQEYDTLEKAVDVAKFLSRVKKKYAVFQKDNKEPSIVFFNGEELTKDMKITRQYSHYNRVNSKKHNMAVLNIFLPNGEQDMYTFPYMSTKNINKIIEAAEKQSGFLYFWKGVI